MNRTVLLYEAHFPDETHSKFNAAFAVAVAHAYPEYKILFRGHPGHLREVQKILVDVNADTIHELTWQPYLPKKGTRIGVKGFTRPLTTAVVDLIVAMQRCKPRLVVILESSSQFILLYKYLTRWLSPPPSLIVQHGIGGRLASKHDTIDYLALAKGNHPGLGYVVLGQPILDLVSTDFPDFKQLCFSLTHPWLWSCDQKYQQGQNLTLPVKLGLLGSAASHTGLELFLKLAFHYKNTRKFLFQTTGALRHLDSPLPSELENVLPLSHTPLTHEVYLQRVQSLTYGLGLWPRQRNRFAASGSFMDALDSVRPGIYLTNPIVAGAFSTMGDIGYLCQNEDEVMGALETIREALPTTRYRLQQETILAKRDIFNAYALKEEYRRTIDTFLAQAAM